MLDTAACRCLGAPPGGPPGTHRREVAGQQTLEENEETEGPRQVDEAPEVQGPPEIKCKGGHCMR